MNELKYSALAATFMIGAFAIMIMGFGVHEVGVVAIGYVPCFVGGWCAAKASWS